MALKRTGFASANTKTACTLCTHNVPGALGILLCNLLCLDCRLVHLAEGQLRDRHIVEDDVEEARPFRQNAPDVFTDHLAHGQQLAGIVLRDDALQGLLWPCKQAACGRHIQHPCIPKLLTPLAAFTFHGHVPGVYPFCLKPGEEALVPEATRAVHGVRTGALTASYLDDGG
eukprot:361014-Chlamydomonas_euryale.AAC.6